MASNQFNQVSYGLTQPLIPESPPPIISQHNPTANDKAQLGTLWVNTLTNATFVLTSIVANQANWAMGNGGAGVFTLTGDTGGVIFPLGGNIDILGTAGEVSVNGSANTLTVQLDAGFVPVTVPNGGTGLTSLTNHAVLVGAGTANVTLVGPGAIQTLFQGMGAAADPIFTANPIVSGTFTAGSNIETTGGDILIDAGNIVLPTTTATEGIIFVNGATFIHNFDGVTPLTSTFVGIGAGTLTSTGTVNDGFGFEVLTNLTSGNDNSGFGAHALFNLTSGTDNIAIGGASLGEITSGSFNVAVGGTALTNIVIGSNNIGIGIASGTNYMAAESDNIIIGNSGVLGESNTIRIGTQGGGVGQQDRCFIAGITGVTVGSSATVVINTSTGQLGTIGTTGQALIVNTTPTGAVTYVATATDCFIAVDTTSVSVTVALPNAPATGRVFFIADSKGNAVANNITVTTVGGVVLIFGTTSQSITGNWGAMQVIFNGTSYNLISSE